MPVFHYCADVLKDELLFSDNDSDSESDGNNSDEGAKYNDFDRKEHSLLDIDEISEYNFSQEVFQRGISSITEEAAIELVPEDMMDDTFLARDEEHPELWQRHHDLLIYDGDINRRRYHECVLLLSVGRYKRAGYCEEGLIRFRIRERNHWEGVDSLYDAWLLLEGRQRKEFNYELFMLRFPGWEDHIQKKYKPPESDIEDSTHRASKREREEIIDSSDEEAVQEAAVRRLQEKKQRLCRKRQCIADSSDEETPKEAAASSQLQEQKQDDLESSPLPSYQAKRQFCILAGNSVKKNSRQTLTKIHPYLLHHRKWKNTQHLH